MSINKTFISGNLTRDGELRQTASGMAVLTFGVAVNDRRKNVETGEWEDYANFIDCVMFAHRAQSLAQYLLKGTKVSIEGKLRWNQWERNGQKRSKITLIVDEIEFLSARKEAAPQPQAQPPQVAAPPQQASVPFQDSFDNRPGAAGSQDFENSLTDADFDDVPLYEGYGAW